MLDKQLTLDALKRIVEIQNIVSETLNDLTDRESEKKLLYSMGYKDLAMFLIDHIEMGTLDVESGTLPSSLQ